MEDEVGPRGAKLGWLRAWGGGRFDVGGAGV